MKKNYTLITPKKSIKNSFLNFNTVLAFLFVLLGMSSSFGQVAITTANGTANSCKLPTDYVTLGDIIIDESANSDFDLATRNIDYTLILTAPINFQFNPGTGNVTSNNGDITGISVVVTNTTITITYRSSNNPVGNRRDEDDIVTLTGIQFRGITTPSTGNIIRTGGNGIINGAAIGSIFGTLTSSNTPPAAIAGGAATVCNGSSTPTFTNPNSGGTWSVTSGTGTATITSPGGVLTGTSPGTVTVNYTIGSCTPATYVVTVNPTPVITTQPVATSICTTGSGTFSVVATGATTYEWRKGGLALTNTAPYSGVNTPTLTITNPVAGDAGSYTVVVENGTCSVTSTARALTVTTVPTTVATTPTPTNAATGICYAGIGAVSSISWSAAAGATSYDVYFGAGGLPGSVTANVLAPTVTFSTGTLLANTTYSWKIVPRYACGITTGTPSTWSFTTASVPCYCTSTYTNGPGFGDGITNVTLGTLNNNSGANTTSPYYTFYNAATIPDLLRPLSTTISISYGTDSNQWGAVWIDFNQNGIFEASEGFVSTVNAGSNGTSVITITVPLGALLGNTRMRVRGGNDSILTTAQACGASSSGFGETEDYIVNIIAAPACITPTAQPTALALTVSGTTINGTFTAAAPAPNSYLVIANTTGIAPTIANGTTYTISQNLGGTNVVVDIDGNTTFSTGNLLPTTKYYFFVYSFNNICTGGPLYLTTLPLTGNALTDYCSPTSFSPSGLYISNVAFVGALQDPPANASTFNATGFQDFTTLPTKAIQAQGEGINIVARAFGTILQRGTWKAWVDWNKNGSFEPATEEVYNIQGFVGADATFGFVIPLLTPPGDYRIRIRANNGTNGASETYGFNFTPCDNFTSVGPTNNYGETEDYLFTVVAKCNSLITTVMSGSNCGAGTVNLQATATSGVTEFRWYTSASGGSYTTSPPSGTSTSFTTPSLLSTTNYYVTAWNGSCESQVRTLVVAKINQTPIVTFSPSNPIICGENTIVQLTANGDKEITYLIDEDFEVGSLGLFTNLNNDTNIPTTDAITAWQSRTSAYVPNTNVWFPAISSGFGTNKFALAYSDAKLPNIPNNTVENSLTLINSVNTNTFLNLTLNLKMYYSRYYPNGYIDPLNDEYVNIEVSTDNGVTYPNIVQSFTSDVGIGSKFAELSFNLSAYINVPNLKIRIRHRSYAGTGWLPDGVAVDDVKLFGEKPLNTAFTYNTAIVDAYTNAAATIPYTSGTPVTTIYIKPTLIQLESALFTIPVSTTLSNGCSATGSINVTNNTKMFSAGTTGTDWNNAANWKPNGVPNANNCVIIYDNDVNITGTNYSALGLNLTVKPTGNLNISSSNTAIITDFVTVEPLGVFEIENDGSLVQINNVTNIGNITYKRIAPGIRGFDYVYWSSPVTGQSLAGIYTSPAQGPKYSWNTTITNGNGGQGNWVNPPAIMAIGSGYIVRGSSSFGMAATAINSTFIGVPNNGTIPVTVQRGNYTGTPYPGANGIPINNLDDNYNLLGNPYPSALNGLQFLSDNSAVIEGNVKLWKHGFSPASTNANPFYASFAYNYSASDYTTINFTGPTTPLLNDIIKSGQAFFVEMKDGASGNNVVNFRNTQRSNSGTPYANDAFFRTTNAEGITSEVIERNRIWLDIVDANNIAETTLLGYITGATEAKESAFDAIASTLPMGIYSVIADETFVIQGRSLPFNNNDQVAIGFNVPNAGNYHIAINTIDGLFLDTTQNIYLEDKITNVIHNLKTSPYSFTTATGIHNERFVLRYTNQTLGTEDFPANDIKVYANESINVIATNQTIKSVRVYDLLGRILGNFNNVNATTFSTTTIVKTQTALIVEVVLENGAKQSHKVIF